MYKLRVETSFAAAHCLINYQGDCENLHGHNWKVEVFVKADKLDSAGLVRDFGEIKGATNELLNGLDHHYLNELPPFQEENPSSEHIARYLFQQLSKGLNDERARVSRVSVWESDTSSATFFEE